MFRDWAADAPDEASMLAAVITGPPEPFVPPELVGQKAVAILGCWCGDLDAGTEAIEPLRALSPSATFSLRCRMSRCRECWMAARARAYATTSVVASSTTSTTRSSTSRSHTAPACPRRCHRSTFHQMGGAVGRVRRGATAFSGRRAAYTYNIIATWTDPAQDIMAARGPSAAADLAAPERRRYLLAELLVCAVCGRRMESAWSNGKAAYRCRHGHSSAARPDPGRAKRLRPRGSHPAAPACPAPAAHGDRVRQAQKAAHLSRDRRDPPGQRRRGDRVPARPPDHPHLRPGRRDPAGSHQRSRQNHHRKAS